VQTENKGSRTRAIADGRDGLKFKRFHADVHKESPGGHSKWEGDDSCGSVDWREGIWWELKILLLPANSTEV
jgi:hypothetical protein